MPTDNNNTTPGIISYCKEHLDIIGITTEVSKSQWRRKIKNYIMELNKTKLLEEARSYKKLDYNEMSTETFERKEYFYKLTLEMVRLRFKISSKIVPTVRNNFKRKYKSTNLSCPSCIDFNPQTSSPREDSQNHLMLDCPAFEEL